MSILNLLILLLWNLDSEPFDPPGGACIDPTGKPWCQP